MGFPFLSLIGLSAALLSPSPGRAAEDCDCERYRALTGFRSLAEQVSQIGLTAVHDEGQALSRERAQALQLRIESDNLIPRHCREKLRSRFEVRDWRLVMRGILGEDLRIARGTVAQAANMPGDGLIGWYDNLYGTRFRGRSEKCRGVVTLPDGASGTFFDSYSPGCIQDGNEAADAYFGQGAEAIALDLASAGIPATLGQAKMLKAFHQLATSGSEKTLLDLSARSRADLSDDEFLAVTAMVGRKLSDNYSDDRAASANDRSVVSGDRLLAAMRSNIRKDGPTHKVVLRGGPFQYEAYAPPAQQFAGVCRDMAVLQAKMLQARGFKNTYVISYSTRSSRHSAVITQKPGSRELAQLNYDAVDRVKNQDGSLAMRRRDMPDNGIDYIVSRPDGRVIANVPSEMGKFLAEAAGFKITRLDPLARASSSIIAADLNAGQRARVGERVFVGQDASGARYIGAGLDVSYARKGVAPGKVGVVEAVQVRPADAFGTQRNEVAQVTYVQIEQHLRAKPIPIAPAAALTLDSSVTLAGAASKNIKVDDSSDGGVGLSGNARADGEARVDHHGPGGKYDASYRAGIQINMMAIRDVRDGGFPRPVPNLNHAYVETSQRYRVAPELTLVGSAIIDKSLLGTRGKAELGVASGQVAATAHAAGRLTRDSSLLEDNSFWRAGADLMWRPSSHFATSASGEVPLEGDDKLSRTRFMLNGNLLF